MLVADNQAFAQFNHMNSAAGQQMLHQDGFPHGGAAGVQAPIFPVSNGHQQVHQQQQPLQMQMPHMQRFHPADAQHMYQQQQQQFQQQQVQHQQQQQQQQIHQQQQQQQQQHHAQPVMHQPLQQPSQGFQTPMQPLGTSPFPAMNQQQPVMRPMSVSPMPLMLQPTCPIASVGGISPTNKPRAKKALVAPPPDEDAADDINEDDIANLPPSKRRPCIHNEWDDVRTRKGSKILRCRMCQRKWKLSSSHVPRCIAFLRSYCPQGDKCQQLHVHKKKSGLKERFEQFGVAVLNAMPPQAKLAAEDAVGMPSRRGSAATSSGSSASGAVLSGTMPAMQPNTNGPQTADERRVSVVDHVRRASVATSTSEPPSLLSGQDRRPSLFSETTVGYETRRTSLAISEYDRRASVISENLVLPEGLQHMLPAHDRRCSAISELNDSRKQQIRSTLDVIQRMAPAPSEALQNYAFGQSEPELKTPTAQGSDDLAGRRAFVAPGLETNSPTEGQRRSSGGSCTSGQNLHCGNSPLHELDATRKSPLYGGPATSFGESLAKARIHPSGLPTRRSRSSMCSDGPPPMPPAQSQNTTSPVAGSPTSASPKSAASFNKVAPPNPENSGVHAMTEDELDAMLTQHEAAIIRRKSLDPENMQNQLGATI